MRSVVRSAAFAALLIPALAWSQDEKPKAKNYSGVDAKTLDVLTKLGTLYKDAKSWRADAVIDATIEPDEGDKREAKFQATIDVEKPNHFAFRSKRSDDADDGQQLVSDGKTMFMLDKKRKQYTEGTAPAKLRGYVQPLGLVGQGGLKTGILLLNILNDEPGEALLEGVNKGEHMGTEKVDGKDAHHLKFRQDGLDWELWVAADGQPFVLKMADVSDRGNAKVKIIEKYSNWKVNAEPAKDAFTFKAPEGATKVKSIGPARGDG